VRSDDSRLDAYVTELFAALAFDGEAQHHYAIRGANDGASGAYELLLDGETIATEQSAEHLIGPLVHRVNRDAITGAPFLVLHAGGVERAGCGVVFPGHMEAGKTTIVAALVRSGCGYLTDEAVALEWSSDFIEPYPKPLSIDPGAWPFFPELEPVDFANGGHKATQWQVPPTAIRPHSLGQRCRARYLIFPRYVPDCDTTLARLGRAEALVELAKNTFDFKHQARRALDALHRVVESADCFRLTMGDLEGACELVIDLTERADVGA
jgi:hypothetical protein